MKGYFLRDPADKLGMVKPRDTGREPVNGEQSDYRDVMYNQWRKAGLKQ